MRIEDIFNEWEKDSVIDETNLDRASLETPKLHHKYYKIYVGEHFALKRLEADYKILEKRKSEWYNGTMDYAEMKELGWEPNPLKILKNDLPMYIGADSDIINFNLRVLAQKEKVDLVESILKTIANRGYHIKNAIEFIRFKNGT